MRSQVLDTVARLLATENLTIVRANVRTASFNVQTRTLTMPIFKGMSEVIEEMMVGHEVGHAKHTSLGLLEKASKYDKRLPGYLNVTEDVRIEKHMKREFPGLRKSFHLGYAELNDMDFFGVKRTDFQTLNLIDKINLYYKVGHDCGVEFSDEEFDFVARTEGTESEQDALNLAIEIFEYQRKISEPDYPPPEYQQAAKSQGKPSEAGGEGEGEGEACSMPGEDAEGDADNSGAKGDGKPGDGKDEDEDGPTGKIGTQFGQGGKPTVGKYMDAKTVAAFENAVAGAADMKTSYAYHSLVAEFALNPIIPYKRVLAETAGLDQYVVSAREDINAIKDESKKSIGYLIKEFEMRKSADLISRSQVAKTGMLANGKLYAYNLKDDIFRRSTVVPKGKNHGMVFLVDWSGSMSDTITNVLRQALDLATFCRRMSIPFEMYGFTTGYKSVAPESINGTVHAKQAEGERRRKAIAANAIKVGDGNFHLIEFMNSDMTNNEFKTMSDRMLTNKFHMARGYTLGGTPLNEALIYMIKRLPEFREKHQVEKLTFITMTDGEGHQVHAFPGQYTNNAPRNFIVDPGNKKHYEVGAEGSGQTHAILRILRDRTGCRSIGYHISEGVNNAQREFAAMAGHALNVNQISKMQQDLKASMAANGCYIMPTSSRDGMFILLNSALQRKPQYHASINPSMTEEQIADQLSASLGNRKRNRIVLDNFIKIIA